MKYLIRNINELKEEDIEFIKETYPVRYEKASKFISGQDYKRCILSYIVLIELIGNFSEKDVSYNEFGKPFIKNKPYFNISHSGEYVAVAIDDNPIGVDIQIMEEKHLKLTKIFTKEEQEYIDKEDTLNRFHLMWSIKEAALKLIGKGITQSFKDVEIIDDDSLRINSTIYKYKKEVVDNNYSFVICYQK